MTATPRECREMIQELEWSGTWEESDKSCCPACKERPTIHNPDCELKAFLGRLTDEALAQNEKRSKALEELFLAAEDLDGNDESWNRLYRALKECRDTKANALMTSSKEKEMPE